jgi:hypothetical protein
LAPQATCHPGKEDPRQSVGGWKWKSVAGNAPQCGLSVAWRLEFSSGISDPGLSIVASIP